MRRFRERKHWLALLAILFVFAACKGDSPTAPPPGTGIPPGTPPPTGVTITLTATNNSPLVDSNTIITATVTDNGQPVPNGTAVEFSTNLGTFLDTETASTIRTTTNGVATVTLTSSTAGTGTVTAAVNNVLRTIGITFRARPTEEPEPGTAPTITSITPAIGRPSGGEIIRINGTNFTAPVRVLFNTGGAVPREAQVVSVSPTVIEVITPGVDLGVGQQLESTIIVITEAGSANEERATATFTFRAEVLTPRITTISPASGPIDGGTRITIFGDGFQAPVQVFFGAAEARVDSIRFDQIIVIAPPGRDTSSDGSQTVTGPVDIAVININSNTRTTSQTPFRYVNAMSITTMRPLSGSALGGTDITIDGTGFDDPLEVLIGPPGAAVRANVIRVSGTQLLVRTPALPSPCNGFTGEVRVRNTNNNDTASSPEQFTFIGVPPRIVELDPTDDPLQPGETVRVTINNAGVGPLGSAIIRFNVNGRSVIPIPGEIFTDDATGESEFLVTVPATGFTFPTVSCPFAPGITGTQLGPVEVPIVFTNTTTNCTDTATLTVNPPEPNPCVQAPPAATVTAPATGCADAGDVDDADPNTGNATITFRNSAAVGAANLTVNFDSVNPVGEFAITPATRSIAPGTSQSFTVTFNPNTTGTRNATATFTTNDPAQPTIDVCLTGNGT